MTRSPETLLHDLCDRYERTEPLEFVFFWGHESPPGTAPAEHCLSQWYPAAFTLEGTTYPTAEHYMMAAKARLFSDGEALQRILDAPDAGTALAIGRLVHGYDQAVWERERFGIVVAGSVAKFSQNPALKAYLLSTDGKILAQATPLERIWGIGLAPDHPDATNPTRWRGPNLLGFALMEARTQLQSHV